MPIATSLPSLNIPSIFDRADGSDPKYGGVPEVAGSVGINTATGNTPTGGAGGHFVQFFQELSDSPTVESGEQATIVHKFACDYDTAQYYMITNPRGTYLTDKGGNTSRVLSTQITPINRTGVRGVILTVTSEGQYPLFPNPPDEFDIETVELNPSLDKHPRYKELTYQMRLLVKNANIADNPDYVNVYQATINSITGSLSGSNLQQQEAQELLFKRHKGLDSFYLSGYKVTWSSYFWYPQLLNPGAYIEDPVQQGGLPAYFWSTTGQVTANPSNNIFSQTSVHNQNMYPNTSSLVTPPFGLSWLRQADTIHLQRTWWRLTRSWIGGPVGHWDNELYNPIHQPYQTVEQQGAI